MEQRQLVAHTYQPVAGVVVMTPILPCAFAETLNSCNTMLHEQDSTIVAHVADDLGVRLLCHHCRRLALV